MDLDAILDVLNADQRRAAEATRGPVCILAGAGTGKTTTITRRIACQVATGAFEPSQILAVTFTDRAAGELRTRLARLGVQGVPARTFHSAALAQLRALSPDPPGELLPSKTLVLRQIGNSLPGAYRYRPAADLATEVEWARNRRIPPERYLDQVGDHEPPIPPDLMARVYREYERRKGARGVLDFEDLLERAIGLYEEDERAVARFRARYHAFTVDEFQDVNLLQRTLLDRWLGDRDELCVVGDDYQAIYGFTGASPSYLLELPRRYPHATVVTLEANYRSSPQVLELANRLVPRLGGAAKTLRATRAEGAEPVLAPWAGPDDEARGIVAWISELDAAGVPLDEIALLYRTNARSEDYEEVLAAAGIPYRVRGGAFLGRSAARRLLPLIAREPGTAVAAIVERLARSSGWVDAVPDGVGEQEATRQADLGRLVALARAFDPSRTCAEFVGDLRARFGEEAEGRGVQLLTLHRAKGLEFEAVAIVRVEEGELPVRQARADEELAEERRLLYVGLTRARRRLLVTWHATRTPSRFLRELGVLARVTKGRAAAGEASPALTALKRWRLERSRTDGVPAYVVFHDRTLEEIAEREPRTHGELAAIGGVGPTKLERYADEVLETLAGLAS